MKKLVLLIPILLLSGFISAQEKTSSLFIEGSNNIAAGFGLGGAYGIGHVGSQSPAFGLHFDHGIVETGGGTIGIGGYVGFKTFSDDYYNYKQRWTYFMIGARGTFHYDVFKVDKLDTYGGVMLAYYALNYHDDIPNSFGFDRAYKGSAYVSIFGGAKYYLSSNIAAFGEVGYGVSWLTLGVSFKF